MSPTTRSAKRRKKAPKPPSSQKNTNKNNKPETIFGRAPNTFTSSNIKHLLAALNKQGAIRKTDSRLTLLSKLTKIESKLNDIDHRIVTQLFSQGTPITRSTIKSGRLGLEHEGDDRKCGVCWDVLPAKNFYLGVSTECKHEEVVCKECLGQSVLEQYASKQWDRMACPLCSCLIAEQQVERFLEGKMLENYQNYMSSLTIRNLSNFRWCLNIHCHAGQLHDDGLNKPKMICKSCRFATCFQHQLPWHENETCAEYDARIFGKDFATEKWIQRQTKKCPNCGTPTLKNGGCSEIYCICGTGWDWYSLKVQDYEKIYGKEEYQELFEAARQPQYG